MSAQTPADPGSADSGAADPRSAGIRVRRAELSDLEQIFAIEVDVFGTDAWSRDLMYAELADKNCHYVVAVIAGDSDASTVVGYGGVLAPRGSGDADIQTIATVPAVRGRGVGRVVMNDLLTAARDARASRVFLEVRADNPIAMGLYRSLGFAEIGVREGYYQPDNVDAVIMRLDVEVGQ